jgi:hypothetical protein
MTGGGGGRDGPASRGVNFRALDDLFALRDERRGDVDYAIRVQARAAAAARLAALRVGGPHCACSPRLPPQVASPKPSTITP